MLPSANYHEKKFKLLLSILLYLVARSNIIKQRLNTLTTKYKMQSFTNILPYFPFCINVAIVE